LRAVSCGDWLEINVYCVLAIGCWLLCIGYWLLSIAYWLLPGYPRSFSRV
jgi:hypothetical protein